MAEKYSDEEAMFRIKQVHGNELVCLESYKGSQKNHKFKCSKCDNIFNSRFSCVLRGSGCAKCNRVGNLGNRKGNKYKKSKVKKDSHVIFIRDKDNEVITKTYIDSEDVDRCKEHTWYLSDGYITSRTAGKLHRFLMNCPKKLKIDHKNLNTLDNRKFNLRICTTVQNNYNRPIRKDNKTGYKGVKIEDKKFVVNIKAEGKLIRIGLFTDIKLAAKAYNKAALKYHGEFAKLNEIT